MNVADLKTTNILGVPIFNGSKDTCIQVLEDALIANKNLFVSTVNPSFLYLSLKNSQFKKILSKQTDLNTPDGVGIQLAGEYLNQKNKNILNGLLIGIKHTVFRKPFSIMPARIDGVYLSSHLLNYCEKKGKDVIIFNRKDGLKSSYQIGDYLLRNFPSLKFSIIDVVAGEMLKNKVKGNLMLCTLGEYQQERFYVLNKKLLTANVYIGIGGTFDVLMNSASPSLFKSLGVDWLYRLFQNPKRLKKVWRSVVLFPLKVYSNSLN